MGMGVFFCINNLFCFALLDTFAIPKLITEAEDNSQSDTSLQNSLEPVITDSSYEDENIKITLQTVRKDDTTIYMANIQLSDASYLKTAFAENVYGRNIKQKTSQIAEANNAIFAINGDYYGFRDAGFVLRNGVLYRSIVREEEDDEALVIDTERNFSVIHENQTDIDSLDLEDISQIFSFGHALIEDGEIVVDSSSEVDQSKTVIRELQSVKSHHFTTLLFLMAAQMKAQGFPCYNLRKFF